jgi:uncharacterized membrane protein required for colicin V production
MSLWILAIVLIAIFFAIGYAQGAIRSAISLVGLILAFFFAIPLGRALKPLVVSLGAANPVWQVLIPPLVAFFVIYFLISGLSFFAHHKVYLMYKYKRDDVDRMRWERMNRHVGAGIGVLMGVIAFLGVSGLIYAGGYLTVQLSGDENPGTIKFLNSAREDMAASGFDKVAAKFQPASQDFYETADVLGLLYHNPLLQSRLATYPYYLSLSQRPEFQEIGNDKEYNDLIFGKAPVTQIIAHPKTQGLLSNAEIMAYLKGTDRKDLQEYLRTGKSPKYEEQEILGVWNLDKSAVVTLIRKAKPDIRSKELRMIKSALESVPDVSLIATTENKVLIRGGGAAPAPAAQAEQPAAVDPLAARYGPEYARSMQRGQNPAPVTNKPPETIASPVPTIKEGEGTWGEENGQYFVTFDAAGQQVKANAKVTADELVLNVAGTSLVFAKQ